MVHKPLSKNKLQFYRLFFTIVLQRSRIPVYELTRGKNLMAFSNKQKSEIIEKFGRNAKDTASSEVQIALLSGRIEHLTEHFKSHKKDNHSRRGLLKLVGQRTRLSKYLKRSEPKSYKALIAKLGLRK